MTLNMNYAITIDDVANLIGSVDDSKHRQIRVSRNGDVSIDTAKNDIEGMAFVFEIFAAGTGYVGLAASQDPEFVKRIYDAMMKNWPTVERDQYIDQF